MQKTLNNRKKDYFQTKIKKTIKLKKEINLQ